MKKSQIPPSVKVQRGVSKAAKTFDPVKNLSLQLRAFAALQLLPSWNGTDAYRAVYNDYESSPEIVKKYAYRENTKEGVKAYKAQIAMQIAGLKGNASIIPSLAPTSGAATTESDLDALVSDERYDKEALINELSKIARTATDDKIKMQALEKIANIDGMKREQSVGNEEVTKFYLPIKCFICSLYKDAVERGEIEEE